MTTPLEIRPVGPEGIGLLERVDPRFRTDLASRQHILDLLGLRLSWLATLDDEPAGYAVVTRHFFNFPFVDLLHVSDALRRGGVGRALMAHCEAAHDADRIFTSTNESNVPMRALMVAMAWRPCGQVDALDPGDPELFFVKFRDRG
jgi:GNAT superfamily N-acetyltransferase